MTQKIKVSKVEYEKARRIKIRLEKIRPAVKKAKEEILKADRILNQIK